MSVEREAYLQAFHEEAAEHIERLAQGVLALERRWPDNDLVAALFRSAHTIKGGAGLLGLGHIAETAHALEDLLDALRHGQRALTPEVIDELLLGIDALRGLLATLTAPAAPTFPSLARPAPAAEGPPAAPAGALSPPAASASAAPADSEAERSLRISIEKLDRVLDLASELLVQQRDLRQRAQAAQGLWRQVMAYERTLASGSSADQRQHWDALRSALHAWQHWTVRSDERVAELADELHYAVERLRMFPLASLFGVFTRTVRDIARAQGKQVRLVVEGEDTEVDKEVLEGLRAPLLHLVRNAIDHGIEPPATRAAAGKPAAGTVTLRARHEAGRAVLTVEDDGAGIDLEAVRRVGLQRGLITAAQADTLGEADILALLFQPGFSTRSEVGTTAGRGVGLDVVKRQVEALKGQIGVRSQRGQGTCFTLSVPLGLALVRVLLVRAGGQHYALPLGAVQGVLPVAWRRLSRLQGRPTVAWGERLLPAATLLQLLGMAEPVDRPEGTRPAAVLATAAGMLAAVVDEVAGEENVVVRPLPPMLRALTLVSGVAPLSERELAIILHPEALVAQARQLAGAPPAPARPQACGQRILVVDDSLIARDLERSILETAGYQVDTAVDGEEALARLNAERYDLVVVDVDMPRLDGLGLVAHIRATPHLADVPAVIVSNRDDPADLQRGLEVGAQAYLAKSTLQPGTLLEIVERLIG
ncbi:MAG: hybrid sensor histidine kinase/response regulator [Chloroflexi bacterium]|nr:hybrid sensor histidine kinase/response regulator [Chloroflexota bacterium]